MKRQVPPLPSTQSSSTLPNATFSSADSNSGLVKVSQDRNGLTVAKGIVLKRGRHLNTWASRFMVLTSTEITYFDTLDEESNGQLLGTIPLNEVIKLYVQTEMCPKKEIKGACFALETVSANGETGFSRTYYFCATDENQKNLWCNLIYAHLRRYSKRGDSVLGDAVRESGRRSPRSGTDGSITPPPPLRGSGSTATGESSPAASSPPHSPAVSPRLEKLMDEQASTGKGSTGKKSGASLLKSLAFGSGSSSSPQSQRKILEGSGKLGGSGTFAWRGLFNKSPEPKEKETKDSRSATETKLSSSESGTVRDAAPSVYELSEEATVGPTAAADPSVVFDYGNFAVSGEFSRISVVPARAAAEGNNVSNDNNNSNNNNNDNNNNSSSSSSSSDDVFFKSEKDGSSNDTGTRSSESGLSGLSSALNNSRSSATTAELEQFHEQLSNE